MNNFQKTIKKKISFEGISLHTGKITKINLIPGKINQGIIFKRTDLKNSKEISAKWKNVKIANLCTMLKNEKGETISTIEHLMFALYVVGISNLTIEVNGSEIPILDGSAILFVEKILQIGFEDQKLELPTIEIPSVIEVKEKEKFIRFEPTKKRKLEIDYTIEYKDKLIKKQNKILKDAQKDYAEVCNSRTFCHQEDLEKIFAMGLAKGGSLDNAIVISGSKVLNQEGLRFKDEFVRHKILDCIGDLYLSGFFIEGKIICNHGGHELTARLLQKIFSNKKNYIIRKNSFSKPIAKKQKLIHHNFKLAI